MRKTRTSRALDSSKRTFSAGSAARMFCQLVFAISSGRRPPTACILIFSVTSYVLDARRGNFPEASSRKVFSRLAVNSIFESESRAQIKLRLSSVLIFCLSPVNCLRRSEQLRLSVRYGASSFSKAFSGEGCQYRLLIMNVSICREGSLEGVSLEMEYPVTRIKEGTLPDSLLISI